MEKHKGVNFVDVEMGKMIYRTIVTYGIIVLLFRMMGKREIGELSLLDIVIFIMMAEIAVFAIEDPDRKIRDATVPMIVLVIIQRLTAIISLKSKRFREWFEGKPSIIVTAGKIDEHEMKKQRYNFDDLTQQLRENGTKSIQDVEYAILEPSGKLSIFEKTPTVSAGFVYTLIMDGDIQRDNLEEINKSEAWLRQELMKKGYDDLKQISFCSIDDNDQWYIDIKNERL